MINKIINTVKQNNFKIVSFDIFDTLIFRTVAIPTDVFRRMYDEDKSLFPEYTDGQDFINARKYAEECARNYNKNKYNTGEVNLDEIYNFLPTVYEEATAIKKLEIKVEKSCAVRNDDIYQTLRAIADSGVKIVLISDMYLSSACLREILQSAGIDLSLVDFIYVSNEWKTCKADGGLFEAVIKNEKITYKDIFHIGDNYYGDAGVTGRLGITSFHYDVISSGEYRYPYLFLEKQIYRNSTRSSIRTLRLLSAQNNKDSEDAFWFEMGAMIVGPFLTYGIEWMLDVADHNEIMTIRPIMREGWFIKKMLDRAVSNRRRNYSIEPMYISRLSVVTATLNRVTPEIIENLLSTCNMRTRDAFEVLKIEDYIGEFSSYADRYLNDLSLEIKDGKIAREALINYLSSPEMISIIRSRNKNSSEYMKEYLKEIGLVNSNAITVDFGWRGSIQYEIDRHLEEMEVAKKPIHLLFFSRPEAVVNIKKGTIVRGFVGNWGKEEFEILSLFPRFLELFFFCEEGTTIGYKKEDNIIRPILKEIPYARYQKISMKSLQEGVLSFQQLFMHIKGEHPELVNDDSIRRETLDGLLRLCSFPTRQEAEALGKLEYDQNFGANSLLPIISNDEVDSLKEKGFSDYYGMVKNTGANWCSGINVIYDPAIYLKNILLQNRKYKYLALTIMAEKSLKRFGDMPVILVGAGENGKMMVVIYRLIGQGMPLYILDNNKDVQTSNIGGVEIKKIDRASVLNNAYYVFSVTYMNAYKELKKQVNQYAETYVGISYFEGEF